MVDNSRKEILYVKFQRKKCIKGSSFSRLALHLQYEYVKVGVVKWKRRNLQQLSARSLEGARHSHGTGSLHKLCSEAGESIHLSFL